jgi:hypothetical protein
LEVLDSHNVKPLSTAPPIGSVIGVLRRLRHKLACAVAHETVHPIALDVIPLAGGRHVSQRALIEGQQVVIPVAICVSPQKWRVTSWANDPDVGALAVARVKDKEDVGLCVDARDYLLPAPFPANFWISYMSNVLMRALRMWFRDTNHLDVSHFGTFQNTGTEVCLTPYAESRGHRGHRRRNNYRC